MPESAVALYVDGAPISDFYAFGQRLFDNESIEVRKGTQGTAYGVNSEAGQSPFQTERTLAAEIGLKGNSSNARIDYALAVFHNRIDDYKDLVISEREFT